MSGGGSSPPPMTREKNAEALFKLKAAPDSPNSALIAAHCQITPSRMIKNVLNSKDVPDGQKQGRTVLRPNGSRPQEMARGVPRERASRAVG